MSPQIGVLASAMLSVLVLAAFVLAWGGWQMFAKRGDKRKGVLMWVCAVVLLGNVAIWAV